jgi:hypothetical protein
MRVLIAKPEQQDTFETIGHGDDRHWRPTVSQISSATNRHFRPLSIEESETHHKWRRAALAFYGVIAISAVLLSIAIGPPSPTAVKNNPAYSAIASRGQYKSH